MSLLTEAMGTFQKWDKTSVEDGIGGFTNKYVPGATFQAVATLDSSTLSQIGQSLGVKSNYKISTAKNVLLQFPDVVERLADHKFFRITDDGTDQKTPNSAMLDMRQVRAEEWRIPNDEK